MLRMLLSITWTAFSLSVVISHWPSLIDPLQVEALIIFFPVAGALYSYESWQRLKT